MLKTPLNNVHYWSSIVLLNLLHRNVLNLGWAHFSYDVDDCLYVGRFLRNSVKQVFVESSKQNLLEHFNHYQLLQLRTLHNQCLHITMNSTILHSSDQMLNKHSMIPGSHQFPSCICLLALVNVEGSHLGTLLHSYHSLYLPSFDYWNILSRMTAIVSAHKCCNASSNWLKYSFCT